MSPANTFQVVLSTDGSKSFVIFLYGNIEWGDATVGFNAGDGTRFLMFPGSLTTNITEIETNSNVGLLGAYVYRVDLPIIIPNGMFMHAKPH